MRAVNIIASILFPLVVSGHLCAAEVPPLGQMATIVSAALQRRLCYEVYWGGNENYRRDVPLPVNVLVEGSRFYARIENLETAPTGEPLAGLYVGGLAQQGARVIKSFEFRQSEFWDGAADVFMPWLQARFVKGPVISIELTLPSTCGPHYDPPCAEKDRMVSNVVATIRQLLRWAVEHPTETLPAYPDEVHVAIADFNVDYPDTYVLVEGTNQVFGVALHDPDGKDEPAYQQSANYAVSQEHGKENLARLIPKIRTHGIGRTIVLTQRR
jgi:hypothetical protein